MLATVRSGASIDRCRCPPVVSLWHHRVALGSLGATTVIRMLRLRREGQSEGVDPIWGAAVQRRSRQRWRAI